MTTRAQDTILSLAVVLFATGCSYTKDLRVLARSQAAEDLDYLAKNLKAIHPDPFTQISEQNLQTRRRQIEGALADKTSRKDFALAVAQLLASIGDSHTALASFPDFHNYRRKGGEVLPIAVRYADGDMVVASCAGGIEPKRLQKGDIITEINGKPMNLLMQEYCRYISAETNLQKYWALEKYLPYLVWAIEGFSADFKLMLSDANGQTYTEKLKAAQPIFRDNRPKFSFDFHIDDSVCLFKATSFDRQSDYVNQKDKVRDRFIDTLDRMLDEMQHRHSRVFVVDLRGNGGGDTSLGIELLKKTAKRPFRTGRRRFRFSEAYQKCWLIYGLQQRRIPAFLHAEDWLNFNDFTPQPVDISELDGEYLIRRGRKQAPYRHNYPVELVLITDRHTGSAAVDLAAIVKDNKLGLIAGEETGGRASAFSEVAPVLLPNSGLLCGISSAYCRRPADFDDGRGVLPDLPLDVTADDAALVEQICSYIEKKTAAKNTQD